MTDEETIAAMIEIQSLAATRGLHGVMLLSPICPKCGACHQFKMMTDLEGSEPQELLEYYAEVAKSEPSAVIDLPHEARH